jgi:hypothetical protein
MVLQGEEWGCKESVVLLDDAAEMEDRDYAESFADVQHDFISLKMLPSVCEHLLRFLSCAQVSGALSEV